MTTTSTTGKDPAVPDMQPVLSVAEIQQAVAHARRAIASPDSCWSHENNLLLARAVLALPEQQPEPVDRKDLAFSIGSSIHWAITNTKALVAADDLLSRYTITTARAAASPTEETQ